ncbi:MAG: hypothetical protein ACLFPU_05450 [Dehalococcoidia bacterium]
MSTKTEFYLGLFSSLIVAFIIPFIVTVLECSALLFLIYLYLPAGVALILHAIYEEEKRYLGTDKSGENSSEQSEQEG